MRARLVLLFAMLIAAGCSDSSIVTNNSPPEATIELPSVGTEVLEGSEVEFAGVVEDRGTRLEELEVTWSSSIDGILLEGLADTEGQTGFTSSDLSIGEHSLDSDEDIADFIRERAETIYHPVGTCKMGADDDPMAVVDSKLRVRNVAGLRVVDASVMPSLVGGNTNAPTIMIAERAAEWIRNDQN